MARVFITGSSDGLGLMAGRLLAGQGHAVVLHGRSASRAQDARAALPEAAGVVIGDLSSLAGMRQVAGQADAAGPFDAIIHNAGVGHRDQPHRHAHPYHARRITSCLMPAAPLSGGAVAFAPRARQ